MSKQAEATRHGGDGQAVPCDQHFVVPVRPTACLACLQKFSPAIFQYRTQFFRCRAEPLGPFFQVHLKSGDIASFEIAFFGNLVAIAENRCMLVTEDFLHLSGGPQVVGPFGAFGVRILAGAESSCRQSQVTQYVIKGLVGKTGEEHILGCLIRIEGCKHHQGLIVKHFFKMRYPPEGIDRVAVHTETDMVVHAAEADMLKGFDSHGAGIFKIETAGDMEKQ